MIIENISKNDLEGLTDSFISAFKSEPWNEKWDYNVAYERIKNCYNTPKSYGLVVKEGDLIVGGAIGVIKVQPDGYVYELTEFFMSKDYQGKKVGTKLYGVLMSKLKNLGIIGVLIITMAGSKAHQFYKLQGAYEMSSSVLLGQEL